MMADIIIQPDGLLILNPGMDDNNILFEHFCCELTTFLQIKLETWGKFSLTCCISVIYKITFNCDKIQHMKFYSKKCRLTTNKEIMEYMHFLKQNLIAKMEMFSNSNDVNPYYTLHKIENIKVFFH